ncbi:hypothetical protein GF371_00775, partial [Candidatus Woesearchaeota archaeon]|nr:hypothetical protein [Candidatus Woesearchaeota archaeon]
MKKMLIAIVLISLFILAGCAKQEIEPVVEETEEPEQMQETETEMPAEETGAEEMQETEAETAETDVQEMEEPAEEEEMVEEADISEAAGELVFDVECDGSTRTVWFKLANPEERDLYFATVHPMERNKYYPAKISLNGRDMGDMKEICGSLKVPVGEVVNCEKTFPEP